MLAGVDYKHCYLNPTEMALCHFRTALFFWCSLPLTQERKCKFNERKIVGFQPDRGTNRFKKDEID